MGYKLVAEQKICIFHQACVYLYVNAFYSIPQFHFLFREPVFPFFVTRHIAGIMSVTETNL